MSYLHDLFFIFSIIFIVIYHITSFKQTYLFFVHFLGHLLFYKTVKNFQKVKVRPQGAASLLLIFFLPISAWTVTPKLPYMITYVCQTFVIRDIRGQIPKRIYQAPYHLPSDFPKRLVIRQKLILKFHSKKMQALTLRIYFKKYTVWWECKAFFLVFFYIISYIFLENVIKIHQVSQEIWVFTYSIFLSNFWIFLPLLAAKNSWRLHQYDNISGFLTWNYFR